MDNINNNKQEKTALSKLHIFLEENQLRIRIEWFRMLARDTLTNETEHGHTGTEIHFLIRGSHEVHTTDQTILLSTMEGIIIPPGCRHRLRNTGGEYVRYVLNFSVEEKPLSWGDAVSVGQERWRDDTSYILSVDTVRCFAVTSPMLALLLECTDESEKEQNGYMTMIKADTMKLLTLLARSIDNGKTEMYTPPKRTSFSKQIASEAEKYIALHIEENTNVSVIARYLNVSEKQLQRICQREMGMTVHQMVTRKRLAVAKEYLSTSTMTLDMIARRTGFSSKENFCRFFREAEGQTPNQYRQGAVPDDGTGV